ncbi:uncharacterized protein RSE6_07193 [Rhynchosporium secalis]|uniref:Uncharacterized protein n=1 Tax=Rhynchosporium secalis TaxID=38038 RepID=A0A1E1MCF2_RHYSE|nr:uncharacterized protein RSE6_07193 [Rhynchosporium secalis]
MGTGNENGNGSCVWSFLAPPPVLRPKTAGLSLGLDMFLDRIDDSLFVVLPQPLRFHGFVSVVSISYDIIRYDRAWPACCFATPPFQFALLSACRILPRPGYYLKSQEVYPSSPTNTTKPLASF